MRETLVHATPEAMERARPDLAKFEAVLTAMPPAGLNRHARRALGAQRDAITHDTIVFLRTLWRDYNVRAIFLAKSIEWNNPRGPVKKLRRHAR